MQREFQVIYRMTDNTGTAAQVPTGPVQTVAVIFEAADQAEAQFKAAGFAVIAVNFVRAVVDWTLPNLDRDEAAEFLRIKSMTISINKGAGKIPFSMVGRGIYPRAWLDQMVIENANPAGRQAANQLTD